MSILSCKIRAGQIYVNIGERRKALDISFESIPYVAATTGSASNNIVVSNGLGFIPGQALTIGGGGLYSGHVTATNSISSGWAYETAGYRLFFHKGYLKCVKKEIPHTQLAITSINYVTLETNKQHNYRQMFCHPAVIWDSIHDSEARKQVQEVILGFAKKHGVTVPGEFTSWGDQFNGLAKAYFFSALDWLAYPIIREIENGVVCKNLTHSDRNYLSPTFEPMNFRELVYHYYGTTTPKMLEEIWKVIKVGGDYKRTTFAIENEQHRSAMATAFMDRDPPDILRATHEYVDQIGDTRVNFIVFTLGAAIFKAMGFDYFYQVIPKFIHNRQSIRDPDPVGESFVSKSDSITTDLKTLLLRVSPRKLLNAMFPDDKELPSRHFLKDTASMIRDYWDVEKIPKTIRDQYPMGLIVDFKFKTLKELHDKISTQYTIIKTEASKKPIPVAQIYGLLNGRERNGLKLVVPYDTSILSTWGKALNICIAGYGDRAADGNTLLLGVEKEGAIKYCIEFRHVVVKKELMPGISYPIKDSEALIPINTETVKDLYPRLEEKHIGISDTDTKPEDEFFYAPQFVQFRGIRNGIPEKEDHADVNSMLITWAQENLPFLKEIEGIFNHESYSGNMFYGGNGAVNMNVQGGVLNAQMIDDAARRAAEQGGQPDIYINHQAMIPAEEPAINHIRFIPVFDNNEI